MRHPRVTGSRVRGMLGSNAQCCTPVVIMDFKEDGARLPVPGRQHDVARMMLAPDHAT